MKTGDKVVCVSDIPTIFPERFKQLPIKGRVYVIRAFDYSPVTGGLGLYLVGIIGAIHPKWRQECGFYAHHFRKLDEEQARENHREALKRRVYSQQHRDRLSKSHFLFQNKKRWRGRYERAGVTGKESFSELLNNPKFLIELAYLK